MEQFICDICDQGFKSPGALASHRYYSHGKGRAHRDLSDGQRELADEVRVLVNRLNEYQDSGNVLKCPDCGDILTLFNDGPGIYKFRCLKCWNEF